MNLYNYFMDILKYDTSSPLDEESLKKFLLKKDINLIYQIHRTWESNTTEIMELIKDYENVYIIGGDDGVAIRELCNFKNSYIKELEWCPHDSYPIGINFLSLQSKSIYLDEKYLYYYIKSCRNREDMDILDMTVYVPSLEIQKEIIEKNMNREIIINRLKNNILKYKKLQSKILKSML